MGKKLKKIIVSGCVIAGVMYFFNKFVEMSAEAIDKFIPDELDLYSWTYGDIFYQKRGTGTPLLLIHDLVPGGSAYEWNKVIDQLAENHTVYSLDLIGCGESDKPEITYTNFIFVKLINDFIKDVIGEKTDVIASGYASSIASTAAHYNKDLFDKIIFVNPADLKYLSQNVDTKSRLIKKIMELPLLGTFIYNFITCKAELQNYFYEKYFYNPFGVKKELIDHYYKNAHEYNNNGKYLLASMISNLCGCNMKLAFSSIDNPVYIIAGDHEYNTQAIQKQYLNMKEDITVYSVQNTCHFPQLEDHNAFMEVINKIYE